MRLDALATIALGLAIALLLCGPVYGCPMTPLRFLTVGALLYVRICLLIALCRGAVQAEREETQEPAEETGERVQFEAWA